VCFEFGGENDLESAGFWYELIPAIQLEKVSMMTLLPSKHYRNKKNEWGDGKWMLSPLLHSSDFTLLVSKSCKEDRFNPDPKMGAAKDPIGILNDE
jgi:hypothetical protein